MKLAYCAVALGMFAGMGAAMAAPASSATASAPSASSEGMTILQNSCSVCHETAVVTGSRKSAADWDATLDRMISQGATLSPTDLASLKAFLVANYSDKPVAAK
jgi:cytochrome c5